MARLPLNLPRSLAPAALKADRRIAAAASYPAAPPQRAHPPKLESIAIVLLQRRLLRAETRCIFDGVELRGCLFGHGILFSSPASLHCVGAEISSLRGEKRRSNPEP